MYDSKQHRGWAYYACIGLLGASLAESGDAGDGLLLMRNALEQLEVMKPQVPSHQRFLITMVRQRLDTLRETETPTPEGTGAAS